MTLLEAWVEIILGKPDAPANKVAETDTPSGLSARHLSEAKLDLAKELCGTEPR